MTDLIEKRVATLVGLAKRYGDANIQFGNTSAVKLSFFLQRLYSTRLGYRFTLYTYGPFDAAVGGAIGYARSRGILDVRYDDSTSGYDITPALPSSNLGALDPDEEAAIDNVVEAFSSFKTRELELFSTICFVYEELGCKRSQRDEIASRIHTLKPHFSDLCIRSGFDWLSKQQLLSLIDKRVTKIA